MSTREERAIVAEKERTRAENKVRGQETQVLKFVPRFGFISKIVRSYLVSKSENR